MKVLNKYPKVTECECGAELEYDKDDIHIGALGCYHITCPICGKEIMLDEEKGIELDENNLKFPTHYFDYKNGNKIEDERINEWVRKCIKYLKENEDEFYTFIGSGNTMVFVFKLEDDEEYYIHVSKNGYETYLPIWYTANIDFE